MAVLVLMIRFILSIYVLLKGQGVCAELTLISTSSSVIEHGTYNMQCITTLDVAFSVWIRNSNDIDTASIGYSGDTCVSTSFIKEQPQMFDYYCYSNETHRVYSLTLLNVSRHRNAETWQCRDNSFIRSKQIVVQVLVPVQNLYFNEHDSNILSLLENNSERISCTTSYSRPRANVTWYITDIQSKVYLTDSNTSYINSTDLVFTQSILKVTLNRTYNAWDLVCEAENVQGYNAVSKSVLLNITYPTNHPTIQCTNNGIYKVVQNTNGRLTCSVDGGNPAGTLHWNCTGDVTNYRGSHNTVTQTIVWTVQQPQYCTCTATNIAGTHPKSVKTEVLYPPVIDSLQDKAEFEGDSVTLQCVVLRANPSVSVIGWTSNKHNISGATLFIPNVSRTDEGTYKCTANNTMDPSCHDSVHGTTSSSLHVDALYPPSVNIPHGKSFTFKEGDRFSYICPVEPGNPPSTNITWRRSTDISTWNSSELLIQNVTRYDDGFYTCYAGNVMKNSNGIIRAGNVSADIRLIVQFKTNVTDFYIRGHRHTSSVTVLENTSLVFECHLHSNPISTVRLYEAEVLVNTSRANMLSYYTWATCSGGPVTYSCHGNNSLSNKPSTRQIQLVVNCTPRRGMNIDELVSAGALNVTVTLSYTALAYPLPSFTWYRGDGLAINTTDERTIVSSIQLQTNLTIFNVAESDFGNYTLTVANNVGTINELFHLKPQGVPEVPSHLTQDDTNTTDSIIALYWTSGFNNGLTQTFTIMYRQQPGDSWQSAIVPDRGPTRTVIHYNITGLSSGTRYEIVLYAVKDIGRSNSNATLTCKTKQSVKSLPNSSPNVSAIVGGTLSGVVVLCIIVVLVFIYRSRLLKDEQDSSTNPSNTYENLKIEQIPSIPLHCQTETTNNQPLEENVDNTYEGLSRQDNDKESQYAHLDNISNDDAKAYENLKIQLSSCDTRSGTDVRV